MNPVADTFLSFSVKRMQLAELEIFQCVDGLNDQQVWLRGGDYENSIANLLLHLEGNLRQWVLHGIAGQADVRQRDAEFTLQAEVSVSELRAHFAATATECRAVISALTPERLLEVIDPQPGGGWGTPTVLEAIYLVVGHMQMHVGQIILLTKQLRKRDLDLSIPRRR